VDNLTHTLVGVTLANGFYRQRVGKAAVPILAIASNLPDLDALVVLSGDPRSVLLRRTFGHSLLLLPIWVLLLTWIFRRFFPQLPFRTILHLTALGAGLHLLFDLVNSFGVVLLWPISQWRPELATVFILDLTLTALLALPLLLCLPKSRRRSLPGLSRISILAVAGYLLFCGGNRWLAERALAREAASLTPAPGFSYVFPEPLGPLRWRGVMRQGDVYHLSLIHSLTGKLEARGEVATSLGDPAVQAVLATEPGRRLERFFKAPVWEVAQHNPGARVTASDLRFRSLVLNRDPVFVFAFQVSADGEVREELHPSDFVRGR
jgi:membrane-bound metal-dependent hydrolase YbcI (DUF457 family)